jgi:uncharacterized glyoxalase superfamily protein PhnB
MARFDFIGLIAADMARTLEFYRRLGMDIPADADDQPHVEITLPGGMRMAWDSVETIRSFDPDFQEARGGNRVALAFACDGPTDVDTTYARLTAAGHQGHREPFDAVWGQRYATVLDPNGVGVDLYAPLS